MQAVNGAAGAATGGRSPLTDCAAEAIPLADLYTATGVSYSSD